jgi:hypothetical protein
MAPVDRLARSVGLDTVLVDGLVQLTENLFAGRFWSFLPIDVRYHDLHHSAQASMCLLALGEGQRRAGVTSLSIRDLELGLAAMMLHDTGFLKTRGDVAGTGANYTHSDVLRSCAEEVPVSQEPLRRTPPGTKPLRPSMAHEWLPPAAPVPMQSVSAALSVAVSGGGGAEAAMAPRNGCKKR